MNNHHNKHIREAIDYAMDHGWTLKKAGARAHVWGMLYCPQADRSGCFMPIYCTPRTPEAHAKDIRRKVDRCSHY
jgi:hypothetical protein